MDTNAKFVCELIDTLNRINEKAVQLRDEIGTGSAVAELRASVQNIIEISCSHMHRK